jgi:hypothetical protein
VALLPSVFTILGFRGDTAGPVHQALVLGSDFERRDALDGLGLTHMLVDWQAVVLLLLTTGVCNVTSVHAGGPLQATACNMTLQGSCVGCRSVLWGPSAAH